MNNKEKQIKLLQGKLDIIMKMLADVSSELQELIKEEEVKPKVCVKNFTPKYEDEDDVEISDFPF